MHDEASGRTSRLNAKAPEYLWLADRKHTAFLLQNLLIVVRKTDETSSTNETCKRYVSFKRSYHYPVKG